MAVASLVAGVGSLSLAATSATAIISRNFSQKKPSSCALVDESQPQFSLRCSGESSGSGSCSSSKQFSLRCSVESSGGGSCSGSKHSQPSRFGKAGGGKALDFTRTKTRIRAIDDIEMEDVQVDYDVERRRPLRPVVERFNIHHEQNVSEERLKELGVRRWLKWDCGPGVTTFWKWKVDELVYISKGSVEVVPDGCNDEAIFYAGDVVRFPKWFEASLTFDEHYEQFYKFLAYGD